MDSLAKRIASDIDVLSDLPSPSPVVARLSSTLGDDDVEVRTIEEIIGQDPVVAGKVIHAANAAAYASHTPTASIRAALLRLGVIRVRRLAMLFGLFNAYPGPKVPEGFMGTTTTHTSGRPAGGAPTRTVPEIEPPAGSRIPTPLTASGACTRT